MSKFAARSRRHIRIIRDSTADNIAEVRAAAYECLGKIGKKDDKDMLIKGLKDDSWLVRSNAMKALSELLGNESIPVVTDMIGDVSLSVIDTLKDVMVAHVEASMPYVEKFICKGDNTAKKLAVEVLEESGQFARVFNTLLSDDSEKRSRAAGLLRCIVEFGAHVGLEAAIAKADDDSRRRILDIIRDVDAGLAGRIERKLRGEIT
jgi:HEAT repeat protein